MSQDTKTPVAASALEVASPDLQSQYNHRSIRAVDGLRLSLTLLSLLCGVTVLGTSGHALNVYNTTSVSTGFLLPLWPDEFDARPTVALVVGSAIVVLASILSLVFSKIPSLRRKVSAHTLVCFITPFIGFAASMIAMIFFYAVNTSTTVDTLQSWSCQWESVEMRVQPYFGTLCRESKTALYLSVVLVPVEAIVLSLAGYQCTLEKRAASLVQPGKRDSPTPSV
ncbi:hypothetical protein PFICI_12998 [Pestalotiopsis fici W106-1]|uniref:MARVEL domain-containing protein n=1 Tax=Pestalotiopsis fici (strain W106-1 / CGMCC3.15140) TaxID=1229662 RepID=W3WQH3_PESFW|nr:uncharacterized protein PFICI_12998 [Pestalotiopsis fici W106-1]ETS76054.1 hypothetical protein PFICI_12998 [Pestalotiopsis fici W106-1]